MSVYDFVIVGAGPAGLAFAHTAASVGKRVLLVEQEATIGGCHRVRRVNGLFAEHGPRIYTGAYKNFSMLLQDLHTSFDEQFTEYTFPSTVGGIGVTSIPWYEIGILFIHFLVLVVLPNHGKNTSMRAFMERYSFNSTTRFYIDAMCRLTDGAGADRYSLNKFLSILNEQTFYRVYQPRKPNDEGFLKVWQEYLLSTGNVTLLLNTTVAEVSEGEVVTADGNRYLADKIILAVPPMSGIRSSSAEYEKWVIDTAYINYLPVTYHWSEKLSIPPSLGFPGSEWGVAWVVLSDYMDFANPRSQTVISSLATKLDTPSSCTGKTVNESTPREIQQEVFRQLSDSVPNLTKEYVAIISPGIYRDENEWKDRDVAWVETAGNGFSPFEVSPGIYTVGTHTGKCEYSFTSLEAAVTNAITLAHQLVPETRNKYPIQGIVKVSQVIRWILIGIVGLLLFRKLYSRNSRMSS